MEDTQLNTDETEDKCEPDYIHSCNTAEGEHIRDIICSYVKECVHLDL